MTDRGPLLRLARETGRQLGQLGVQPGDARWIRSHAETIASLVGVAPKRSLGDRVERVLRGLWRRLR